MAGINRLDANVHKPQSWADLKYIDNEESLFGAQFELSFDRFRWLVAFFRIELKVNNMLILAIATGINRLEVASRFATQSHVALEHIAVR
ncbi:MAG: hypothetical protein QMA97_02305 [Glaciecola sp.]